MRATATARILALLFATVMAIPFTPLVADAVVPPAPESGGAYYLVEVPEAAANTLLGSGLSIVESYESFTLVRDPRGLVPSLQAQGLSILPAEDLFTLGMNGYSFDVRDAEPTLPDALRIAYAPGESGRYLVHFVGPVKEEWTWRVEALGASVDRYIPNSGYIVRMTPEVADAVRGLPRVDYVGPFHPAYRIRSDLLDRTDVVDVKLITFADESVDPVLAFLGKHGVPRESAGAGMPGVLSFTETGDFGVVKARVPAGLLPEIARLRGVEYIEPIYAMSIANTDMQWVHQSDSSGVRTEWSASPVLNGTGQILAIADTGIDFDNEQFRQNSSTAGGVYDIQLGGLTGSQSIYNFTDLNRRKIARYFPMSVVAEGKLWYGVGGDPNAGKDSPNDPFGCRFGHGTAVASTAAGNDDPIGIMSPGTDDGIGKGAKIFFEDIGTETPTAGCASGLDSTLSYIPDSYADMFQPAYDGGARIHSNSWGSPNSDYDLEARMIDHYVWQHPDFLVIFSNGNNGPSLGTVGSPAVNKNGMGIGWNGNPNTCDGGATENDVNSLSSRGATLDSRAKPDIMAVGYGRSAMSDGNPLTSAATAQACWSGTSYSAPAAAGGMTILRQYLADGWWPTGAPLTGNQMDPSAALMKALAMAGSRKMTGSGPSGATGTWTYPNWNQGFGRYTLDDSLYLAGEAKDTWLHDYTSGLTTGQTWTTKVYVNGNTESLRFVLAWSDYPGAVAASPALVNDLNLRVTAPNGVSVYPGNCWGQTFALSDSRTTAFCATPDSRNPVEGVIFASGAAAVTAGEWTIQVSALNVPVGPQPFGIVVIGDLERDYGNVFFDKPEYTEGDTVQLEVVDTNGPAVSLDVTVTSPTEPAGETVTLMQTGAGSGRYLGTLDIGFGVTAPDSVLQVSDGDTITASYVDGSPFLHTSTMTADVEFIFPIISGVLATGISNSAATIEWVTDVPANSTVYYGPTPSLGFVVQADSGRELRVAHALGVSNLSTDTIYYYDVCSTDRAGHEACDDRAGLHYTFRTSLKGEILLVVADGTFTEERVQMYRDALAARQWAMNEWHVSTQGMPTLAVLRDYKVILWQVGLEQYPPFDDAAMTLLNDVSTGNPSDDDDYLDGGGRLFISGHDIGWASCDLANSQWATAARCNWVRSTTKTVFQLDFSDGFPSLDGYAGSPISGPYDAPGSVCYSRHRDGGPGDEINGNPAGGTTTLDVWRDFGGSATPDDIAARWVSSANNGSLLPGAWTWKGSASKVVSYMFEFSGIENPTGITPCSDNPGVRADILNRTVTWLLGSGATPRDHPWAQVGYPNGGEILSVSPVSITWTKTVSGGLFILDQALYYSDNAGQSWVPLAYNIPGGDTVFSWNIASLPNGKDYLVKVVARDSGIPSLNGSDESDATFRIDRGAAGDTMGPLTWPDSPRISPDPATTGQSATITATVDDSSRGNANIATPTSAEYYIDTDPGVGAATAMGLASAPTSPMEDVTWTGSLPFVTAGWHSLCARGQDAYGNWGLAVCTPFYVLLSGPPPPQPVTNVHATLPGGGQNIQVTWAASPSEGTGDFDHYEVHRGTVYSPTGLGYAVLPAANNLPAGTTSFWDNTTAVGVTYFYVVKAVGPGGAVNGDYQAAKFVKAVAATTVLLGIPLQLQNTQVGSVFQSVSFDTIRYYDAASGDPWKGFDSGKTANEITTLDYRLALWVHVNTAGEWRIAGRVPTSTLVNLQPSWNFVSYPSFIDRTVGATLFPLSCPKVESYDATQGPYYLRVAAGGDTLTAGNGVWVSCLAATTWTVTNT
ncbi:MAG TPA: S8 family serine peptidase [Thermoplasmata archaeon]|nr:S8 family serine peptidase [Thermoplasmata archaeon]